VVDLVDLAGDLRAEVVVVLGDQQPARAARGEAADAQRGLRGDVRDAARDTRRAGSPRARARRRARRRDTDRGFEGLTASADGTKLYAIMQSPLNTRSAPRLPPSLRSGVRTSGSSSSLSLAKIRSERL